MLIFAACQPGSTPVDEPKDTLLVTVSILPQAYFVERIGGDAVQVNVMVGPGEDPHTYEPKPEQMRALSESQLFFTIGTEYEGAWLPRFADVNPEMAFVDSADGIMRIMEAIPHSHDHDEAHVDQDEYHPEEVHEQSTGLDPHIWLSPANGKLIARNIYNALVAASPADEDLFSANYEELIADIDALDQRIIETLSSTTQRTFMVFHPAWGYFADQYQLTQLPVEVGGQEPSASDLATLIGIARKENIRVIFIQPTTSAANARAIAQEIDAEVVVVDPLARDWLGNLERAAAAFAAALEGEP